MAAETAGTGAIVEIEEPPAVDGRELRLARELRIRTREERAARRELARLTEQLARHARATRVQLQDARAEGATRAEQAAVERALTHEQWQIERTRAERLAAEVARLGAEVARLRAETEARRAALADSDASLQRMRVEGDRVESALRAARTQLEASERARAREAAEHAARARRLEQAVSALTVALRETRVDIERVERSRAWRIGHFLTRTLSRLARRPIRTRGALVAARTRIERAQSAVHEPPGQADGARTTASGATEPAASATLQPALPASFERLSPEQERELASNRAQLAARLRERLGPAPELEAWPLVSAIVPTRNGLHHLERLFAGLVEHTSYPQLEVIVVDNGSEDGTLAYLDSLDTPFPTHVLANDENLTFAEANAHGAGRARGELLLFLNNDIEPFEDGWLKELVGALRTDGVQAVGATLLHPEDPALADGEPRVQHRVVRFRWQDEMIKGFNDGDGEGLWEGAFGVEQRAPAVTAACMLIARASFERVGGFDASYRYGTEDVDLGLKLLVAGDECAGVGRAVLYHRESSTQNRASSDFRRLNRLENRRLFLERWAPQVRREYRLARLRRDPFWAGAAGAHVAITLTSLDVRDGWGDWYSGHEIGDALQALGWQVTYVQRKGEQWYELPGELDYVLSLMDPFDLRRVPDHVTTIAWIRNWTERWLERPWFERADVLLVSSHGSAELIEARTGRQTVRFPLAVNPARFRPRTPREPPARETVDYVFTGNWWGVDRDIQRALDPRDGERLAIYGKDWEKVPELAPYARGEAPYEQLPALYASAKLVLDDTQGPTLPYGAVNARVFDALATGTLVITNCESGARELFDEQFPVWDSRETLRGKLDELLGDERRRTELAARYRETVLTRHTYAHRAAQLRELLVAHEQRLTFCVKIGAPNRDVAPLWGDLHYAESLARELRRRGHRTLVQTLDEWEDEGGLSHDVVVHLKGLSRFQPKPGQLNVLWSISHPDELSGEECDGYDLVAVASPLFAQRLRERTRTPVAVLEQATDAWVMRPQPRAELAHELAYVANSRGVLRPVVRDLLPTERDLAIWGAHWEGLIDTSYVLGEHVPNSELSHVYSSAGIVLNDHWDDMRAHGYISNRVYDALACGALVLSDDVPGLAERFGDAVAIYRSPQELRELVERLLADPAERRRRGARGRELVLANHTFAHRVDELLALVHERAEQPQHARRLRAVA